MSRQIYLKIIIGLTLSSTLVGHRAYSADLLSRLGIKAQEKLVFALHLYDTDQRSVKERIRADSDKLTPMVADLHEKYGLPVEHIRDDKMQSDSTKYRTITFENVGGEYYVRAFEAGFRESIYERIDAKYMQMVGKLFSDIQNEADFIGSYNGEIGYSGGGVSYTAANLPESNQVSLVCENVVYSDKSGGNSCFTRVEKINLTTPGLKVFRHVGGIDTLITQFPWSKSTFEQDSKMIDFAIENFKLKGF